jgi:hypothetical protein
VPQYSPAVASTNESDWESKDVAQALVKREYACRLPLRFGGVGAPAYALGAVGGAGSLGARGFGPSWVRPNAGSRNAGQCYDRKQRHRGSRESLAGREA